MSGCGWDAVGGVLRELGWHGKVIWADAFFGRLFGMAVRAPCGADGVPFILVLPRCHSVHTCGMRYLLDIAFADERGRVVSVHSRVPPGRFLCEPDASFVVERPSPIRADECVVPASARVA